MDVSRRGSSTATLSNTFAGVIHVQPGKDGVKGDGTGDDTVKIQALLDKVSPALGVTTVVVHSGTYMINGVKAQSPTSNQWIGAGLMPKTGSNIVMAPDAVLKTITNSSPGSACVYLGVGQNNITITGGQILGDRATHDYTTEVATHEFGYGIVMHGAQDVLIEGVKISGCTGDAIALLNIGNFSSGGIAYVDNQRVTIRRCTLDGSRRNNISLVACDTVTVEGCTITNAGTNDGVKDGTAPRLGIDIEQGVNGDNTPASIAKNIVVKGNRFTGNVTGSVSNYNGSRVVIESNHADGTMSYGFGTDTVIRGNTVVNTSDTTRVGITSNNGGSGTYKANLVQGNVVRGFNVGIQASQRDATIIGNHVSDFVTTGIGVFALTRALIADNTILDGTGASAAAVGISGTSTDIAVRGNMIRNTRTAVVISGTGNTCVIESNVITKGLQAVNVAAGSTATIRGNTIDLPGHAAGQTYDLQWSGTSIVVCEGNLIRNSSTYAINATNSTGGVSRIIGNRIMDAAGINTISCTGGKHEIIDNTFVGNKSSTLVSAVLLSGGTKHLLMNNVAYHSGADVYDALATISGSATATRAVGNTIVGAAAVFGGTPAGDEVNTANNLIAA